MSTQLPLTAIKRAPTSSDENLSALLEAHKRLAADLTTAQQRLARLESQLHDVHAAANRVTQLEEENRALKQRIEVPQQPTAAREIAEDLQQAHGEIANLEAELRSMHESKGALILELVQLRESTNAASHAAALNDEKNINLMAQVQTLEQARDAAELRILALDQALKAARQDGEWASDRAAAAERELARVRFDYERETATAKELHGPVGGLGEQRNATVQREPESIPTASPALREVLDAVKVAQQDNQATNAAILERLAGLVCLVEDVRAAQAGRATPMDQQPTGQHSNTLVLDQLQTAELDSGAAGAKNLSSGMAVTERDTSVMVADTLDKGAVTGEDTTWKERYGSIEEAWLDAQDIGDHHEYGHFVGIVRQLTSGNARYTDQSVLLADLHMVQLRLGRLFSYCLLDTTLKSMHRPMLNAALIATRMARVEKDRRSCKL